VADLNELCGRVLGEFVLRERLDEGGFGAVYRCDQPLLGRNVVVKVMHQRRRRHDVALQRFMREAQLASRLDHPYAAHVYAFGVEDDGLLWIAMELVQGITLTRWLRERGPLPLDQFVPFFDRVAEVVQAAHERGIVHRDLKPANVMVIESAGQLLPKLLDFGVAKLIDDTTTTPPPTPAEAEEALADIAADAEATTMPLRLAAPDKAGHRPERLTRADAAIGSPPYMAPEQWTDPVSVGRSADLYALGIVAYEALTGRTPFSAKTVDQYSHLHRNAEVPPLGDGFSPALDRVFARALAKQPEDRWGSALELASALRGELRAHMREQVRSSARQWQDRARPQGLLWRGDVLVDLERWTQRTPSVVLGEPERSFLAASRRHARRAMWTRRLLGAITVATIFSAFLYRAALQTRLAERIATVTKMQAELEQGRQSVLHNELADAEPHLGAAHSLGDHSPGTEFMLAVARQFRRAQQAQFASTAGRMMSAVFSPSGQQIVTTDDKAAQVWDAQTHQRLFTLAHGDTVYQALYTADSAWIVTVAGDGRVRIWNAASGDLVRTLTHDRSDGQRSRYSWVAMSPDCRFIAAIDMQGDRAHVWDARTGAALAELRNDAAEFPSIAFSADSRWLATSGGNDVRVFDTSQWTQTVTLAGPHIHGVSFDPTGPRLATASSSGDASVWMIPSGQRILHLREIGEPVDAVAFSPNGALIVAASRDGAEQIWDTASGRLVSQGNYLRSRIYSLEFDPTSKLVVAAGASGTAVVADAALGMAVTTVGGSRNIIRTVHFDPSSRRIIGASWDGIARVWDATSPYRYWGSPPISDDCGIATGLEPDRRFVAVGCRDHQTQIWDTLRDRLVAELPSVTRVDADFPSALPAVSVAGDRAAIARGHAVEIYELPSGRLVRTIMHPAPVTAVGFATAGPDVVSGSIDGTVLVTQGDHEPIVLPAFSQGIDAAGFLVDGRVVAADAGKRLRVYDPGHRAVLADIDTQRRVMALRPSQDGTRLVTLPTYVGAPGPPILWDLERYRVIGPLEGHIGRVFSARFTLGGHEIVTGGGDGTVRRWDSDTGQLRQTYSGSSVFLADATLTPDGLMMVAGGGEGLLRFWDAASGRPLWTMPAHKSYLIGIHFEGADIVTRGFGGEISRWRMPTLAGEIGTCDGNAGCDIVPR
jgi:WD40 repeat protein/serine/threonine protein kinase